MKTIMLICHTLQEAIPELNFIFGRSFSEIIIKLLQCPSRHSLKISYHKAYKNLNSGYVDNTIHLFVIMQTNVVSMDSSMFIQGPWIFHNKKSVES